MTFDEFAEWIKYHQAAYPAIGQWLDRNDGQLRIWAQILTDTDLATAKAATDQLVADATQPKGYADHPRQIRRIAYTLRPKRANTTWVAGQPTYHCPKCLDTGILTVLTPATNRALREGDKAHGIRKCAMACACNHGQNLANPTGGTKPLPRYREGLPIILETDLFNCPDPWATATARLAELDAHSHELPEFADYA